MEPPATHPALGSLPARRAGAGSAVQVPPPVAAPWVVAPSATNVPHAFVPHTDTMSPTAAPWAGPAAARQEVKLSKSAPDLIAAQPALPPVHPVVADPAGPSTAQQSPVFTPARKCITSTGELQQFLESQTIRDFMGFVMAVNEACVGKKLSVLAALPSSDTITRLKALLDVLGKWVDEIPPLEQSLRYGNPAFRLWHARLTAQAEALLADVLPPHLHPAIVELVPYLNDSFGNPTRIDYGTGHETTFVALLYCLARLGLLTNQDCGAVAGAVFVQYITLMRRIQTTYWLEPAGSHGVWGLDDYQFFPFLWGAAQLVNHPMIRPKSIHNADTLDAYAPEYLYLAAVQFVRQVKKGPLQETSPIICDISTVPTWQKVNTGMVKMYQAEVLSKLPIMQHFLFGSCLPFPADHTDDGAGSVGNNGQEQAVPALV